MSKFLTPPVWYDKNGNLVEILTGSSTEPYNVTIGNDTEAHGNSNVLIGYHGQVYGNDNVIIGSGTQMGSEYNPVNSVIQIGQPNVTYTFRAGNVNVLDRMYASDSGTFTGNEGGSGNYTAGFYRVGGLVTFYVSVTFTPVMSANADMFDLTINIPQAYRPFGDIQIDSVVAEPTVTQIWNLLSGVSNNLAVGSIPSHGWYVSPDSYKTIPLNGQWKLVGNGYTEGSESSGTFTMRCVYYTAY